MGDMYANDIHMSSQPTTPPLSPARREEARGVKRERERARSPEPKRRHIRRHYDSYRPRDSSPAPQVPTAPRATAMRSYSPLRFTYSHSRSDGPPQPPPRPSNAPRVDPNPVIGVFGLSIRTRERDLEDEFGRFGEVDKVTIVYDQRTDRSRGFGFITMHSTEDAAKCIENLNGMVLHGRAIRVDYSATNRAHAPTPGEYRGEKRPFDDRFYRNDRYRGGDRYDDRRGFDRGDRWGDRDRGDRWAPSDRNESWRDRDGPGGPPPRRDVDDPYGGRSRRDEDRSANVDRRRSPSPPRRRVSQSPERRPEPRF